MKWTKSSANFKIMQLTDLHVGDLPFNDKDQQTLNLIKEQVAFVRPDLLIVTGDLIWSKNKTDPAQTMEQLIQFFNTLHTPIAITYGNHDSEEGVTRTELRAMEKQLTHPATKKHHFIVEDRECYCIELTNAQGQLENVLYVIDSGAYDFLEVGKYAYVHPAQVEWFRRVSHYYKQEKKQTTTDLLFLHIPLPEYQEAWESGETSGEKGEEVCAPALNTGLFTSLLLDQQVKGVFCGHDHDNDFTAEFHGITLGYGRVTGFNTYGQLDRGSRIVELQGNHAFQTYIISKEQEDEV
ncbi:metallophosphoesterase family protein [Gracilibacillus phocaeensis]|uniref:metallophosphoesterase family protein n=1 Tax=Gracilibacillus phocaeensis TaxID=2042304 RepID=UPI0010315425|nr:metallophosphoesterase family protein [Gracilibacillus phocaeensis]